MSPLQDFYIPDDFSHGSRHGLQPATPFGVKVSAIRLSPKRLIKRQALASPVTRSRSCKDRREPRPPMVPSYGREGGSRRPEPCNQRSRSRYHSTKKARSSKMSELCICHAKFVLCVIDDVELPNQLHQDLAEPMKSVQELQ